MSRASSLALLAAFVVVFVVASWTLGDPPTSLPPSAAPGTASATSAVGHATALPHADSPPTRQAPPEEAASLPTGEGTLCVRARHVRDDVPAAGMNLRITLAAAAKVTHARARTDAAGRAMLENLPAGTVWLHNDRGDSARAISIRPGATTEIDFAVQRGIRFEGAVVDAAGEPVPDATVELWSHQDPDERAVVAVTDRRGAFAVLDVHLESSIAARVAGFVASTPLRMRDVLTDKPNRLVLGANGCAATGFVVDAAGAPIVDAVVAIGEGQPGKVASALARTDRFGRFYCVGLAAGPQPLLVHAHGRTSCRTTIEVVHGESPQQRIVLQHAARISGIVRDAHGRPVRGARVRVASPEGDSVLTAKDGVFELAGVPSGDLLVEALGPGPQAKAEARVTTIAGQDLTLDLQLPAAAPPSSR